MKVWLAMRLFEYEPGEIVGVYATAESAKRGCEATESTEVEWEGDLDGVWSGRVGSSWSYQVGEWSVVDWEIRS